MFLPSSREYSKTTTTVLCKKPDNGEYSVLGWLSFVGKTEYGRPALVYFGLKANKIKASVVRDPTAELLGKPKWPEKWKTSSLFKLDQIALASAKQEFVDTCEKGNRRSRTFTRKVLVNCKWARCGEKFESVTEQQSHQEDCTFHPSFCKHCETIAETTLATHMNNCKSHPNICCFCEKRFSSSASLNGHKASCKKKHGKKSAEKAPKRKANTSLRLCPGCSTPKEANKKKCRNAFCHLSGKKPHSLSSPSTPSSPPKFDHAGLNNLSSQIHAARLAADAAAEKAAEKAAKKAAAAAASKVAVGNSNSDAGYKLLLQQQLREQRYTTERLFNLVERKSTQQQIATPMRRAVVTGTKFNTM